MSNDKYLQDAKESLVHIEIRQEKPNGPRQTTFHSLSHYRLFFNDLDGSQAVVEVEADDFWKERHRIQQYGPRTPPATSAAPFSYTGLEEAGGQFGNWMRLLRPVRGSGRKRLDNSDLNALIKEASEKRASRIGEIGEMAKSLGWTDNVFEHPEPKR